jgi:glycerophosphoryl diester phosphodiesterase
MLHNLPKPTIFAHRGASAYAPENTLAAFSLAVDQAADALEMDAKLTADGHVVLFHDQSLERITGHPGRVNALNLDDLCKFDAGIHFDKDFIGERIPTLNQVFETIERRCYYNLELTNYASPFDDLPDKVVSLVQEHQLEDYVFLSSFNPLALLRTKRLLPGAPVALLAQAGRSGTWARSQLGYLLSYQALHISFEDANREIVEKTHRRKCRLHTYTVNQADEMRCQIEMGVDGIFTDDPRLAKEIIMPDYVSEHIH